MSALDEQVCPKCGADLAIVFGIAPVTFRCVQCGHEEVEPSATPEEKWQLARRELLGLITGKQNVTYQIPDWEPVEEAMALRWLQSSIYEGFVVSFSLRSIGQANEVLFSISEPDYE